jgi:hypothetical protein
MRERVALHATAAAVTVLVLAPLVAPGYVLSYDMVFVPHQPLRWDLVAPTGALPRAVPQDAVVSALSLIAPGWLLQRLALGGAIYAAALGAGRLVPTAGLLPRVIVALTYAWTPFLAERLLLGQWGLLLAYGALPWLVSAAIGVRQQRPGALPRLILPAAVSAITPTGGLIALVVTMVLTLGRRPARTSIVATAAVTLLNAPWLLAAALTAAGGRSDADGVAAFAARSENWSGVYGAIAGTGGVWNAQTTPGSRASVFAPLVTAVLLTLGAIGLPRLLRRWPGGAATRLAAVAAGSVVVALAGTTALSAQGLTWLVGSVPGAGLLRDGQKFLIPYALLLSLCVGLGAERISERLPSAVSRVVLVAVVVVPVAALPDLAWGAAGQLRPVSYPADWERVSEAVADAPGDVLSLPFDLYRAPPWNRGRPVIDPTPRYLPAPVVVDDTLRVGSIVVNGEDPRAARVQQALARGDLTDLDDIRWVVVHKDAGGAVESGALDSLRLAYDGRFLALYANPDYTDSAAPGGAHRWLILVAYLLAVAVIVAAIWRFAASLPRGNVRHV